jgi:hypothetical protein
MQNAELHTLIEKTLTEFEAINTTDVSDDWNNSLMRKLNASKKNKLSPLVKMSLSAFALIICLNASFVITTFFSVAKTQQQQELQTLQNELLINEIK